MIHFGKVRPGSILYVPFSSYAGSTGASVTMTGLAVGDIGVYKNGSTTQRASTSGFSLLDTDGTDFDGITGVHGFSIDLADNSDAGFYVAGGSYFIAVSTVTVDSQTVSFLAASFQIGYPSALYDTTIATLATQTSFTLTAGPAEDSALLGCQVVIHDIASAIQMGTGFITAYTGSTKTVTLAAGATFTVAAGDNLSVFRPALLPTTLGRTLDVSTGGEAGVDWANVGSPSTSLNLSATTIAITQKVDVDTIKTNPVVNGGTITFPTGATLASTTNLTAGTIATVSGNVNGNVGGNVTGSVGSVATGGITTASFAAGAINAAAIAADAIGASELAADAVAEIADAVWDEAIAGHLGAGSTGNALNAAGSAGDPWTTAIPGAYGAGTAGHRLGNIPDIAAGGAGGLFIAGSNAATTVNITGNVTGNLSGSVGSVTGNVGGNVTGSVGSIATGGIAAASFTAGAIDATAIAADAIGSSELAASAVTEIQSGLSTLDAAGVRSAVGLAAANLDTQLSGINAKTTNLPASPAAVGSAMTLAANAVDANAVATDAVNEITAAIKALVVESAGSYTLGQVLSILLAALAGVTADGGATLKSPNGAATRIAATINVSNERTAMTLTPSV
jgi:hypothetical protein